MKALNPDQTIAVAELLKDIEIPTLLIWVKEDRFQPWEAVGLKLKSLLPGPDVVIIEDAGYFYRLSSRVITCKPCFLGEDH